MPTHGSDEPDDPDSGDEELPDRRRAALMLVLVLLLVIGGVALVHVLRNMSQIQDCAMSGRTNCAPIDAGTAGGPGQ